MGLINSINKLYSHTCPECLSEALAMFPIETLASGKESEKSLLDAVRNGLTENVVKDLSRVYTDNFHKAITGVFGDVKPESKYFRHVQEFKLNTARFAQFKSQRCIDMLTNAFNADPANFDAKGGQIIKLFKRWQASEYNTAVARSRSAKQFINFLEQKELYPNIEWLQSRAAVADEIHRRYWGIILPVVHPFWTEHIPGDHWGCQCDIHNTDKPATAVPRKILAPVRGLEGNPAITGELFTDTHPYIRKAKDVDKVNKSVIKEVVKPAILDYKQTIPLHKALIVESANIATGKMLIIRRVADDIYEHAGSDFKLQTYGVGLEHKIKDWAYVGWTAVKKGKHPEAAYFLYYKKVMNGLVRFLNVKVHKTFNAEVPYAVTEFVEKTKKGLPKDIGDYIKK